MFCLLFCSFPPVAMGFASSLEQRFLFLPFQIRLYSRREKGREQGLRKVLCLPWSTVFCLPQCCTTCRLPQESSQSFLVSLEKSLQENTSVLYVCSPRELPTIHQPTLDLYKCVNNPSRILLAGVCLQTSHINRLQLPVSSEILS